MTAKRFAQSTIAVATLFLAALGVPSATGQTEPPDSAAAKPRPTARTARATVPGTARPTSQILERSLGWTSGVLAAGAIALIVSRKLARSAGLTNGTSGERAIVTSRVQLTSRQSVHVVRIGQRTLVIGTGPQGAPVALAEWPAEAGDAEPDEIALPEISVRTHEDDCAADFTVPSMASKGAAA